jgi:dTDP-4-dehydrorhamnose 3,5-epimerase
MQVSQTTLRGVQMIRQKRHGDDRGWFAEVFQARDYRAAGLPAEFVQDNQSSSLQGVLRGLHYQVGQQQGKLVRVLSGHIWDVALDLRRASPTFGRWEGFHLQPVNAEGEMELLWIPEGFAHGFLVLSPSTEVLYKTTEFYEPASERCILWNDPALGIAWPLEGIEPVVSAKDRLGKLFAEAELPGVYTPPPPYINSTH